MISAMANGVRALVTGGAGSVGSNLAGSLVDGGFDVRVLDDRSSGIGSALEPLTDVKFAGGREGMAAVEHSFPPPGWVSHPLR